MEPLCSPFGVFFLCFSQVLIPRVFHWVTTASWLLRVSILGAPQTRGQEPAQQCKWTCIDSPLCETLSTPCLDFSATPCGVRHYCFHFTKAKSVQINIIDFVKGHRFERGCILDYNIQNIKDQVLELLMSNVLKGVFFFNRTITDTRKSLNIFHILRVMYNFSPDE